MHAEPFLLLAIHSFTPVYEGQRRAMELGVLFDDRYSLQGQELGRLLAAQGFCVALNEPYSGHDGLIYSVARHGATFSIPYLEIEIRQDLLESMPRIADVTARLDVALTQFRSYP